MDLFRGVPVILLVYLVGFGIPALELSGLPTDPIVLGGIALTLSYGAYVAEVYRAGIASVHRGQRDAALAIGLTEGQALRHVILPQAVRRVGPPLLNDFIALQKDVALVSILGIVEAFRRPRSSPRRPSTTRRWSPPRCSTSASRCRWRGSSTASASGGGPRYERPRSSSSAGVTKSFGEPRCCAGSTWRSPSTRRSP